MIKKLLFIIMALSIALLVFSSRNHWFSEDIRAFYGNANPIILKGTRSQGDQYKYVLQTSRDIYRPVYDVYLLSESNQFKSKILRDVQIEVTAYAGQKKYQLNRFLPLSDSTFRHSLEDRFWLGYVWSDSNDNVTIIVKGLPERFDNYYLLLAPPFDGAGAGIVDFIIDIRDVILSIALLMMATMCGLYFWEFRMQHQSSTQS